MSKFVSSFTLAEVTAAERTSARALGTSSRPGLQLVIKAASTITPAASRQLIVLFMYRYIRNFNYFRDFKDFNCRFLSSFCSCFSFSVQGLGQGLEPRAWAGGFAEGFSPRAWTGVFAGGLGRGFCRGLGQGFLPRAWAVGFRRGLEPRGFCRGFRQGLAPRVFAEGLAGVLQVI